MAGNSDDMKSGKNENQKLKAENKQEIINLKTDFQLINTNNLTTILIIIISSIALAYFTNLNSTTPLKTTTPPKKYWIEGKNLDTGYLKNVILVLDRLGYESNPNGTSWDLLWSHEYPFRTLYDKLRNLKPHQRVNHLPGCGYITNKVNLATSGLKYIPPAFKLPDDKDKLLEFSEIYPKKKFVEKNNDHRHVKVKDLKDVDLESNNSFVQEFIDRPLLVDGHMFDIGVYTVISSIDPLRVYIYNGDFLLRFCPDEYYPFDPNNLNKYVIGDDYLPIWKVPGINFYYNNLGFGMRDSLSAYLKSKGKDSLKIWNQIEDSIKTVALSRHELLMPIVKRFNFKRNFFEIMRFDFVVDENLNVSLLEANMSPNLSSAHFKPNQLLYEQVLFNIFGLLGLDNKVRRNDLKAKDMQSAFKNIAVMSEFCETCARNCDEDLFCRLCKPCMPSNLREDIFNSFKEHLNRGDCKRIFPPTMVQNGDFPEDFDDYSAENQLIYQWFKEKCALDVTWCT